MATERGRLNFEKIERANLLEVINDKKWNKDMQRTWCAPSCVVAFLPCVCAIDFLLVQIYCHVFWVLELNCLLDFWFFVCFLLVLPLVSLIEYDKLFG